VSITKEEAVKFLSELPEEQLSTLAITSWQYTPSSSSERPPVDSDGFSIDGGSSNATVTLDALQKECWVKYLGNPQVNTAIRGTCGRLTGEGFETFSKILEVQTAIEKIEEDQRNRMYLFWPKYVGRAKVFGELYLCLTCHDDGFIEIDFVEPSSIRGGEKGDGVIYHPKKTSMPLAYFVYDDEENLEIILSTFCARYPELIELAKETDSNFAKNKIAKSGKKAFRKTKGYYRFIVSWDQSMITRRNVSHLRTVLEWLNNYETLKKYEIDHKKSAGAYLWVITMEDPKAFKRWLGLSDAEKRATGIMAKKTPGSTLVLPPGMKLVAQNPNLPNISEQDTDILHLVTSGLNEPEDVSTGQSKGTFASVKESRGPMSDRISDETAYFRRFLTHDFWGNIFYLMSCVSDFPTEVKVEKTIGFKNKKPIRKLVPVRPEKTLEISFPKSEVNDAESRARALLGVKHGSTKDTMGYPLSAIAKEMGMGNYHKNRMLSADEDEEYPELIMTADQESIQEQTEAEPSRKKGAEDDKGRNKGNN
jgi:hypothetical protein